MKTPDYIIKPGAKVKLKDFDPNTTDSIADEDEASDILKKNRKQIIQLQKQLYAENAQSLLVVFQAMDTGGKDGCIENVFKGVNPAGVRVNSFKVPSALEASHDYLWRYHQKAPEVGDIGVFNRSHYEEVLVVRVKDLVPKSVWSKRYDQIVAFEEILQERQTRIIKFYLHISKDEQKARIESRLKNPNKRWKYSSADIAERAYWDDYQEAFEDAISKTSTRLAPWYIVPANHKWYRDVVVSSVVLDTLKEMDPRFPLPEEHIEDVVVPD